MKKILLVFSIALLLFSCSSTTEEQDKKEILTLIAKQEQAWSKHDLEGFMKGYWKSDSLKFYGSNGITYGWDKTLANYKKGYPTPDHSGTLKFKINDITKIEKESYYVLEKINGEWKIVADTSC